MVVAILNSTQIRCATEMGWFDVLNSTQSRRAMELGCWRLDSNQIRCVTEMSC
jgi:hypothetical protein